MPLLDAGHLSFCYQWFSPPHPADFFFIFFSCGMHYVNCADFWYFISVCCTEAAGCADFRDFSSARCGRCLRRGSILDLFSSCCTQSFWRAEIAGFFQFAYHEIQPFRFPLLDASACMVAKKFLLSKISVKNDACATWENLKPNVCVSQRE